MGGRCLPATEGNAGSRRSSMEGTCGLHGGIDVRLADHANHSGPGTRACGGADPIGGGQVGTQVEDVHSCPPGGDAERERPKLMARARWQPDQHGADAGIGASGCLVGGREPAMHGVAGGMFGRDVQLAALPGGTELAERG